VKHDPENDDEDEGKTRPEAQINQGRLLPPFDGGDDGCAAFGTYPRMVADMRAAFVAWDEGHRKSNWPGSLWPVVTPLAHRKRGLHPSLIIQHTDFLFPIFVGVMNMNGAFVPIDFLFTNRTKPNCFLFCVGHINYLAT
jgi:hypothetical protein